MSSSTRVLLLDAEADRSRALGDRLRENGYTVFRESSGATGVSVVLTESPDIVLLSGQPSDMSILDFAYRMKSAGDLEDIPILFLGDPTITGAEIAASIDDVVPEPFTDGELMQRLSVARRLKTMQDELRQREATMRRYGVRTGLPEIGQIDTAGAKILIVGSDNPDTVAAAAMLRNDANLTVVPGCEQAVESIMNGRVELVIVGIDGDGAACLDLCRVIRDNPRFFHLPLLIIAPPDAFEDPAAPIASGASDVLPSPLRAGELKIRVATLIRQERLRDRVLSIYREASQLTGNDNLTGLYSHGFLHDHLSHLIAKAETRHKTLSVGFFDVTGMATINARYGYSAGDALLGQLGTIIGRLVRSEDLPARHGGQEFCVILPDTPMEAANVMIQRVAGVVAFTDFALHGVNEAVCVHLHTGSAELAPGDGVETLIGRARGAAKGVRAAA